VDGREWRRTTARRCEVTKIFPGVWEKLVEWRCGP